MEEADRKHLYWALLRGIAEECQDRLCAADEGHVWSPWHYTALQADLPIWPVSGDAVAVDSLTYRARADRTCLNCGKAEMR